MATAAYVTMTRTELFAVAASFLKMREYAKLNVMRVAVFLPSSSGLHLKCP